MTEPDAFVASDKVLLKMLHRREGLTVSEIAASMEVTATAVRQRLNRLRGQGLVARESESSGRGRPVHRYRLTATGRRMSGANFADLAIALWQEIRTIESPEIRRGLLQRVSQRMAAMYEDVVEGQSVAEKMESLAELFEQREVPFEVRHAETPGQEDLPILTALACPYPDLAEQDRSICAMERILISEVVGRDVKLSSCRLDGATCCTFEPAPLAAGPATT